MEPLLRILSNVDLAELRAAAQAAKIAAQEAEIVKLRVFVRYGLGPADEIDMDSGIINRAEVRDG